MKRFRIFFIILAHYKLNLENNPNYQREKKNKKIKTEWGHSSIELILMSELVSRASIDNERSLRRNEETFVH